MGGTLPPSSALAATCAAPRSGIDPATNLAYPDKQGTSADEKKWLRSWTDELYLWYREVSNADPTGAETVPAYFQLMKTPATTSTGKAKDRFHFTYPTSDWVALSQSGVETGYGAQWLILSGKPPRKLVVAYVEPNSPAAIANLHRGDEVLRVDGVDLAYGTDVNALNAGLFPSAPNQVHTFDLRDVGQVIRTGVRLTSANVVSTPVQNVHSIPMPFGKVGYMLFNQHIATAEDQLIAAINQLQRDAVTDLVIDIRYNGGGFLSIAGELAFMIAGPSATAGRTFERLAFNDKYPTTDPVTGRPLAPTPFYFRSLGFGAPPAGQPLPHLDLPRVFVLTGAGTCSASESIINGLRGVNVQVIQIGAPTCGKPYGFHPRDNCGTTYFSIQFQGVNDKGFGDYADGFVPAGTGPAGTPGCAVADDFTKPLGDPTEARLSRALAYATNPTCTAPVAVAARAQALSVPAQAEGQLVRSPWRENRIVGR